MVDLSDDNRSIDGFGLGPEKEGQSASMLAKGGGKRRQFVDYP